MMEQNKLKAIMFAFLAAVFYAINVPISKVLLILVHLWHKCTNIKGSFATCGPDYNGSIVVSRCWDWYWDDVLG